MKPKIELALSGGGVPGACVHAGFVDAIREHYDIVEIAGTSAGAIVASVYATNPGACMKDLIIDHLCDRTLFEGGPLSLALGDSVYENDNLRKVLEGLIGNKRVHIQLSVVAADIDRRKDFCWTFLPRYTGNLVDKVLASSAVPVLLPPVKVNGRTYVDGGVVNNLPMDCLSDQYPQIGAYFPDTGKRDPGVVGYAEALVGTIVNGNVANTMERYPDATYIPLKMTGAMLPKSISAQDAHHLCRTGYMIGRDHLRALR